MAEEQKNVEVPAQETKVEETAPVVAEPAKEETPAPAAEATTEDKPAEAAAEETKAEDKPEEVKPVEEGLLSHKAQGLSFPK